ncbi:MAG: phosphate acyltransferase PlsX [Cytophagales bacterium]|nr:MAG: phosphate acyltransferase PlsX [Cytophagales bacterium]
MNIALDAMGGDFAPKATIEGAFLAKKSYGNDITITLIGNQEIIHSHLNDLGIDSNLFPIVHAPSVINMGEHPAKAFQQKQDSSIAIGFGMLMKQKADVFCSAGNTGAMLVGSMFTIKPISGILRPGIAGFLPKENGEFGIILDVGANADCKPEYLEQFGVIGSLYAQYAFNKTNPTVALMNLGEEEEKGNILSLTAHQLLKSNKSINFVGNVEGRDVFNSKYDVIVCDGFSGNIILKMAESIFDVMEYKKIKSDFIDLFNYAAVGGSPILGVNGNVIIGHGISSPFAIKNMIEQGKTLAQSKVCDKIKETYHQ